MVPSALSSAWVPGYAEFVVETKSSSAWRKYARGARRRTLKRERLWRRGHTGHGRDDAPRMKYPPKYIRSRLYFSAFLEMIDDVSLHAGNSDILGGPKQDQQ